MSFSVKAWDSSSQQSSPLMQPYRSPKHPIQEGGHVSSFSLNDDRTHAKRVGTDPAKYKTTICRNWEQTGTCTFRGCTFAHGVEELRAPVRADHHTSHLTSQRVSPGGTPPLHAAQPSSYGNPRFEMLLEMLHTEVMRERELVAVHMEASRSLEGVLRNEQLQHDATKAALAKTKKAFDEFVHLVQEQSSALRKILSPEQAQVQEKLWKAIPHVNLSASQDIDGAQSTCDGASRESESIKGGSDEQPESEMERIQELLFTLKS